jgi:hypothetical protein
VQLAADESHVLVSELTRARIVRYWLKGDKAATWDYFAVNLPGYPDNIRPRKSGGFWLALTSVRKFEHPTSLLDSLSTYPQIRAMLANKLPPNLLDAIFPHYGMVLALDEFGNIVESFQDPGGKVITSSSQVTEDDGRLYITWAFLDFIGKLKLREDL